jgi:hypothetical protein
MIIFVNIILVLIYTSTAESSFVRKLSASKYRRSFCDIRGGGGASDLQTQMSSIQKKLNLENNIPIFEFGDIMSAALGLAESSEDASSAYVELEFLYNDYMGRLRDYYLTYFQRSSSLDDLSNIPKREFLAVNREKAVRECERAMKAALITPSTTTLLWSHEVSIL